MPATNETTEYVKLKRRGMPSCGWDASHVRPGGLPFRSDGQPIFYRGAWFCDDICRLCYVDNGHQPLSDAQRTEKAAAIKRQERIDADYRRDVLAREKAQAELERQARLAGNA